MTLPFGRTSFPELYESELVGPLFRPWVDPLLDAVGLRAGERVLDIACGSGIGARVARERLGDGAPVVGVDVSPLMLDVARRVAPDIDWRQGDAGALPLGEGEQFDVVLCQQGLQFFPDRARAVREMYRALAPGGRLGVSTWRPDEEFPFLRELRRVAEDHLGPIADRRHSLGDAGELEALLRDAGFRDVRSQTVSRTIRFEDGSPFVRLNALALVGMSERGRDMDDEARQRAVVAIERDSADIAGRKATGSALTYELGTNLATGRR